MNPSSPSNPSPSSTSSAHPHEPTPFLRALGSLDSPNWGDERSREVGLEGAAVGFAGLSSLVVLVAAAMVWVGGQPLLLWSTALIWAVAGGGMLAQRYRRAHGIPNVALKAAYREVQGRVWLALVLFWGVGAVLAAGDRQLSGPTILGAFTGAGVAIAAVVLLRRRDARQSEAALPPDDDFGPSA